MKKTQDCAADVKAMSNTGYLAHFKKGNFLKQGHNTPTEEVQNWFQNTIGRAKDALGFGHDAPHPEAEAVKPNEVPLPDTMKEVEELHSKPLRGQKGRPGLWK